MNTQMIDRRTYRCPYDIVLMEDMGEIKKGWMRCPSCGFCMETRESKDRTLKEGEKFENVKLRPAATASKRSRY